MSEQIREQVSAFLDGELPDSETELLLKRLTRDTQLRDSFGRYALIGEAMRGSGAGVLKRDFAGRVNHAIDAEPIPLAPVGEGMRKPAPRWWRPLAGTAVAAGVAAVAVVALQQRAQMPAPLRASQSAVSVAAASPTRVAQALPAGGTPVSREALAYTVPAAVPGTAAALAPARLTNYVFAHSRYSSGLGQRGVLADMLIEDEDQPSEHRDAGDVSPPQAVTTRVP